MSTAGHAAEGGDRPSDAAEPFKSTVRLGSVAGVEIGVNWTWLLVFGLIVWSLSAVVFPSVAPDRRPAVYAAAGIVGALTFFGSLLLHELGHAIQARRENVDIQGITLWLFGGVAKLCGEFPSAGAEFRIAIAGPAVTLVLGIAFIVCAALWPTPGIVRAVLAWLGYINLMLIAFNMIPAIPLDGGRVLRSALWARDGDLARATHRATRIGAFLAWVLIGLGLLQAFAGLFQGLWLAVIGWFVLAAGRAEEQRVVVEGALAELSVSELMTVAPVTVPAHCSLADVADSLAGTPRHTADPVAGPHGIVGLLPFGALIDHPPPMWTSIGVDACMLPLDAVPQLTPDTSALTALERLTASPVGRGLVVDGGRLVGILSITDLARTMTLGGPLRTASGSVAR
jgi:Zn-dependent protease